MTKKIVLSLIFIVLLAAIAGGVAIYRYPLAAFAYWNRQALTKSGLTKTTVESPVGPQTLWVGGEGQPLLLLHGAGDQAGSWAKVAPELLAHYRVIVPDLAGHGESAPASGPLTIGMLLQATDSLLQREAGGRPAILVGNSLGAWLATVYAHRHPQQVARVMLVNGGALRGDRPNLSLMPADRAEARHLFELLFDPGSPRVPDFVLDDIIRHSRNGPIFRLAQTQAEMPAYLLDGRLQEVSTPVDIIWGEADRLIPMEYARRMQAQLPAARLTTIPRCGHVPQQECPRAFTRELQKVLDRPAPQPTPREPARVAAP